VRGGGKKKDLEPAVVRGFLPRWGEIVAGAVGVLYLASLVTGSFPRSKDPLGSHLPATFVHFAQAAGLFPNAAEAIIDYRLEVWSCRARAFQELDTRVYFPMRPDDKENRFERLGFFYRHDAKVLSTLDEWLAAAHDGPHVPDGVDGPIGGIRLSSLRLPVPPHGEIERWNPRPLTELPASVKKRWYETPPAVRDQRCAGRS